MFETVLIANRGEIAARIMQTCRRMQIKTVAVYSEADAHALPVRLADDAVLIGPPNAYNDVERIIEAARVAGAQAIHPGYGFLAESASAAARVAEAGLTWIGPSPAAIATMSDKIAARNAVAAVGVPIAPGSEQPLHNIDGVLADAHRFGYPVILKAVIGGGGLAVAVAYDDRQLRAVFEPVRERAARFHAAPTFLVERYLPRVRHIEVQILGLADGRIVALGERDGSVQRRHQKIADEAPAPGLAPEIRDRLARAARQVAEVVDYRNAGTVEFLMEPLSGDFVFCEMNSRLQVEHPVTELVTGVDLVEQQLLVAAGERPTFDVDDGPVINGHAVGARIYAEDPHWFRTAAGKITAWREPRGEGIRVDTGYGKRDHVPPYYDPLLTKLAAWGPDRETALERLDTALLHLKIEGPACNAPFFREMLADPAYVAGTYDTGLVARLRPDL